MQSLLAIATVCGTTGAQAATCPAPRLATQAAVKQYIVASEEAWAKSVATNDASVVKRILADDFIWVLDGRLVDKKTAVKEAAAGPGSFVSNEPDYVHVRFFGDTAVAQGSETWSRKDGRRGKFVWTDTWVQRAGCWQIVNAQDTGCAFSRQIALAYVRFGSKADTSNFPVRKGEGCYHCAMTRVP